MKTSKIIIAFSLILLMLASFSSLFVFAVTQDPTVSLVANKETVKPGDTVIINVNLENITATEIKSGTIEVEYDSDAFTFQTSASNITRAANFITISLANEPVNSGKVNVVSLTFKAADIFGDINFTVTQVSLKDENDDPISNITKDNLVISIQSSDAYLRTLEVDEAELNKPFSKDVYNYSLSVKNSITRINIIATPNNEFATVIIKGNTSLSVGENKVEIIVTAQDEVTKKTYTITVTRAGSSSSSSESSSRSSQGKTSVSIATYSRSESSSSQVSSAVVPVKNSSEQDTPIGLLLIVAILCAGFGGLGGYVIREYLYKKNKG